MLAYRVSLNRTVSAAAVIRLSVIDIKASTTQTRSRIVVARNACRLPLAAQRTSLPVLPPVVLEKQRKK